MEHSSLITDASDVLLYHYLVVPGDDTRRQLFIDRLTMTATQTPSLSSVNVPGALIDARGGHVTTVDYEVQTLKNILWSDCLVQLGPTALGTPQADSTGNDDWTLPLLSCTVTHRSLRLGQLDGAVWHEIANTALGEATPVIWLSTETTLFAFGITSDL